MAALDEGEVGEAFSRKGFLLPSEVSGGVVLSLVPEKVEVKCAPGPVSAEGSGACMGSIR